MGRVAVVLTRGRDGRTEVKTVDKHSGKECRTGMKIGNDQASIDGRVVPIIETLKRAGNEVTVHHR